MANERVYTVNLSDAYRSPRKKHARSAIKILRSFLAKNTKTDMVKLKISNTLNEFIWRFSIQKPPRKIKVKVIVEGDITKAYLPEEKVELKKDEKKSPEKATNKENKKEAVKPEPAEERKKDTEKETKNEKK